MDTKVTNQGMPSHGWPFSLVLIFLQGYAMLCFVESFIRSDASVCFYVLKEFKKKINFIIILINIFF